MGWWKESWPLLVIAGKFLTSLGLHLHLENEVCEWVISKAASSCKAPPSLEQLVPSVAFHHPHAAFSLVGQAECIASQPLVALPGPQLPRKGLTLDPGVTSTTSTVSYPVWGLQAALFGFLCLSSHHALFLLSTFSSLSHTQHPPSHIDHGTCPLCEVLPP